MASYDSTLLASAPAATKSQLQEGYATDLLEKPVPSPGQSRPDLHDQSNNAQRDIERQQALPPAKVPWYRTKKGIIILAVALIVIIAAAVGGGVGGSKKKKNNTDAASQQAGSAGGGQGASGTSSSAGSSVSGSSTTGAPSQGAGGQTPTATPTPTDPTATQGAGGGGQTTITSIALPPIFSSRAPIIITTESPTQGTSS